MTTTPRAAAQAISENPQLPVGDDERFTGFGVMGMPFASGHYLALRDMVATSVGPAYRAVWHRDPSGRWTIHTTIAPELSCPRYFGSAESSVRVLGMELSWSDEFTLKVAIGDILSWRIELDSTLATRMMTTMAGILPESAWNSNAVLAVMGPMARVLQSGRMRLRGATPNGPGFKAAPVKVWRVVGGNASFGGKDFGTPIPLHKQTRLGDFWLPQRGIFYVGQARFTPPAEEKHPSLSSMRATMGG
jgi:hypothetical protein